MWFCDTAAEFFMFVRRWEHVRVWSMCLTNVMINKQHLCTLHLLRHLIISSQFFMTSLIQQVSCTKVKFSVSLFKDGALTHSALLHTHTHCAVLYNRIITYNVLWTFISRNKKHFIIHKRQSARNDCVRFSIILLSNADLFDFFMNSNIAVCALIVYWYIGSWHLIHQESTHYNLKWTADVYMCQR